MRAQFKNILTFLIDFVSSVGTGEGLINSIIGAALETGIDFSWRPLVPIMWYTSNI